MKKKIDILFLIVDVKSTLDTSPILRSQVLDLACFLSDIGFNIGIVSSYRDKLFFTNTILSDPSNSGITFYLFKHRSLLFNLFAIQFYYFYIRFKYSIRYVYVRSFWPLFIGLLTFLNLPPRYIYDLRGDIIDESSRSSTSFRSQFFVFLESLALSRAHHITSVSSPLSILVRNRSSLSYLPTVIPCCVNSKINTFNSSFRRSFRSDYCYSDDDIVFVYSGGLSDYQMISPMLFIWRYFLHNFPAVKFMFLTNASQSDLYTKYGDLDDFQDRISLFKLDHRDVFSVLTCADIGFLLRETRPLNICASPVKFAQYLSAGLSVVSSPSIGDISSCIQLNNLGVLCDVNNITTSIINLSLFIHSFLPSRSKYRQRSLAIASQRYHWTSYTDSFRDIYGN